MRKWLAVIFLMIFSFQVLPMKGLAKLLCKNQNTEEVQGDNAGDDDDATGVAALYSNDIILSRITFDAQATSHYFENKVSVTIRKTKALPFVYLAKIPSPPPDFI